MEHKCSPCNRIFDSEESLKQHNAVKHPEGIKSESGKVGFRKYFILSAIGLIVIFSALTVYSYTQKPGQYDEFAKCLTATGAVVYGNDFCSYTNKQLNFFGKSDKYLNYVKCINNEALCDEKGVEVTPTWEIDGKMYSQVQTFESLSRLSGCEV